jgi:transcription initiation factor TFIID subunit TAF12
VIAPIVTGSIMATAALISTCWILKQWRDKRRDTKQKEQQQQQQQQEVQPQPQQSDISITYGYPFLGVQHQPPTWPGSAQEVKQPNGPWAGWPSGADQL